MARVVRGVADDVIERDQQRAAHEAEVAERNAVRKLLDDMETEQRKRLEERRNERRPGPRRQSP